MLVENKTCKTPLGNNEDGSRVTFPALFFHPCSALWEGRERRDSACVVKRPTCIVASLRMRKYTFFYHKFVLQGVFSKRNDCKSYIGISIYIFSGAHGLPIFLIALTRAHASENYFVRNWKYLKTKWKQRNLIFKTFLYYPQVRGFWGESSQNSLRQTLMFLLKLTSGALKRNEIQLVDYSWDCQLITNYRRCVTLNGFRGNRTQQVQCYI